MENYRHEFIRFAVQSKVLRFGKFTLKSGRISPYFFNAGLFNQGAQLAQLGQVYAQTLVEADTPFDMLFGPAYKGIPLVSSTAIALATQYQRNVGYCFNRKENKDHGEGGHLVGAPLEGKVIIVDDVITAGTAFRESVAIIEQSQQAQLAGIIIALDRQELGLGEQSAIEEIERDHGIPVLSIITLDDIITYLEQEEGNHQYLEQITQYRLTYGLTERH